MLLLACVIGTIMTAVGGGGTATATPQSAASNPPPVGTSVAAGNPTATNTTIAAAANQATATVAPKAAPTEKPATVTPTPKPAPTEKPPTATPTPLPGLNQLVAVKNWDLAVADVTRPGKELIWSQYGNKSAAAGTWLVVVLDMKNTGTQNFGVNATDFTLYGAGGVKYAVSTDMGGYGYSELKGGQRIGSQVPPRVSVRYYVIFDVAPDASGLTFRFNQDKQPTFAIGDAAR